MKVVIKDFKIILGMYDSRDAVDLRTALDDSCGWNPKMNAMCGQVHDGVRHCHDDTYEIWSHEHDRHFWFPTETCIVME